MKRCRSPAATAGASPCSKTARCRAGAQTGKGSSATPRGTARAEKKSSCRRRRCLSGKLPQSQPAVSSPWSCKRTGPSSSGTPNGKGRYPSVVPELHEVVAIAAGTDFGLALLRNGTVKSWGTNRAGQLGDNSTEAATVPRTVPHQKELLRSPQEIKPAWFFCKAAPSRRGGTTKKATWATARTPAPKSAFANTASTNTSHVVATRSRSVD